MKTVKEVSRLTGVSVRTLHHYDAIGLLKPTAVTEAGYRLYDEQTLGKLQTILLFRELEFPLKEIKGLLTAEHFDPMAALADQIHLLGVGVQLFVVICFEVHVHHSCVLNVTGVVDEPIQLLPAKLQQPDLIIQGGHGIKVLRGKQFLDLLQGKFQLPEEEDGLKTPQCLFVIEPVSGLRYFCGLQQPNGVIVVERAHTHTGQATDLFDCFHGDPSRLTIV